MPFILNKRREELVSNARWHFKSLVELNTNGEQLEQHHLKGCVWHTFLAVFDGLFVPIWNGYTLDHDIASLADKLKSSMEELLIPFLVRIVSCDNLHERGHLVYQFMRICMCILDPTGGTMKYNQVFCQVFGVTPLTHKEERVMLECERDTLKSLGFSIHRYREGDGTIGETLYWSGEKKERTAA